MSDPGARRWRVVGFSSLLDAADLLRLKSEAFGQLCTEGLHGRLKMQRRKNSLGVYAALAVVLLSDKVVFSRIVPRFNQWTWDLTMAAMRQEGGLRGCFFL